MKWRMRIGSHKIIFDLAVGVMNLFALIQTFDSFLWVAIELVTNGVVSRPIGGVVA